MCCFLSLFILFCFCVPSARAEDASTFLETSLAKFSKLPSYYVEGTREDTLTDDIQRDWHEDAFTIAKMPGKRYHFDIRRVDMWDVVVSNGNTEWDFQPRRNEYVQRPTPDLTRTSSGPDDKIRARASQYAQNYLEDLAGDKIASAEFLPDEEITLGSERVSCRVVRANLLLSEDTARDRPVQVTYWIENERGLVRKQSIESFITESQLEPLRRVRSITITSYTKMDVHGPPPDKLFRFTPPTTAKQVSRLFLNMRAVDLTGLPAPALKLKTFDGRAFDAESLKGHLVLVDFWASWCVPCIQQMPSIAALNKKYSKLGLVVIGVNSMDDVKDASEFLRKHDYGWINLRDVNGETAKAWMLDGVPLVALIDSGGKIVYYHTGYEQPEEEAILEALKKTNSSFYSVAHKKGN